MSITPKRSDIDNKVLPNDVRSTTSKVSINDIDEVQITIHDSDTSDLLASYKYHVPNIYNTQHINKTHDNDDKLFGIQEGLVVARLATEALVNIVHKTSYPIPFGYGELLSQYGMAEVRFVDESYKATSIDTNLFPTLMFSGGADSSHIMFQRLQGKCNLVSFNHGQGNFRQGIHNEETASHLVPELVRPFFGERLEQCFVKARWKCTLERSFAKAYRNMMLMAHAATVFPGTKILVGTSKDDRLMDSFPDFIERFASVTGITVEAPNLYTGRDTIMKDLINISLEHIPYYYSSTSSCQLQRYLGGKHMQCGVCHSCILRTPAAPFGGDPRFNNLNTNLKLVPEYLEQKGFTTDLVYKRKPSKNALKTFFEDLGTDDGIFQDFLPTVKMMEQQWSVPINKVLSKEQLAIYTS